MTAGYRILVFRVQVCPKLINVIDDLAPDLIYLNIMFCVYFVGTEDEKNCLNFKIHQFDFFDVIAWNILENASHNFKTFYSRKKVFNCNFHIVWDQAQR